MNMLRSPRQSNCARCDLLPEIFLYVMLVKNPATQNQFLSAVVVKKMENNKKFPFLFKNYLFSSVFIFLKA